jgi:hypothetical protein
MDFVTDRPSSRSPIQSVRRDEDPRDLLIATRARPLRAGRIGEPFLDAPSPLLGEALLAGGPLLSESGAHSKGPLFWNGEDVMLL